MQEMSLSKGGELLLQTQIQRSKGGLSVTVRTSPVIEDMMAQMSEVAPRNVLEFGRYWQSPTELQVYGLTADLGGLKGVTGTLGYRMDRPSQALDLPLDRHMPGLTIVNLSFLRLVGASEGVSFTLNQVYSRDGVADLCKKIEEATRHFYIQYLKPVDMRIMVMTQALS